MTVQTRGHPPSKRKPFSRLSVVAILMAFGFVVAVLLGAFNKDDAREISAGQTSQGALPIPSSG